MCTNKSFIDEDDILYGEFVSQEFIDEDFIDGDEEDILNMMFEDSESMDANWPDYED